MKRHIKSAPNPHIPHPIPGQERVGFLKKFITRPDVHVGDYSYYDDPGGVEHFEQNNILYLYDGGGVVLRIGKYCALATGTTFIMSGANHRMDGCSTFPFPIMGGAWAEHMELISGLSHKGDTVLGHDIWTGYQSLVMPGVSIGHGSIIAARAVVTRDIPPYSVVAGNPGTVVKQRFSKKETDLLLELSWWDWPIEKITKNITTIMSSGPEELAAIA